MQNKLKPTTPSQRHTILIKNKFLKKNINKNLIKNIKKSNGRNNQGKITVRHRGGGHKKLYRFISFKRENIKGIIKQIEYDPNRSSYILYLKDNEKFNYILAPNDVKINTYLDSGSDANIQIGNALPLRNIPIGSIIHNLSLKQNKKGQLIRSAGSYAQLIQKYLDKYAKVKLKSGKFINIPLSCYATLGTVSNLEHKNRVIGKAGRSRWLNKRPKVRGVAKNPVDHPHGGGEGKTSGGRPSVSFKGIITKGLKTRKKKKKCLVVK